jgi:hypothetical protein
MLRAGATTTDYLLAYSEDLELLDIEADERGPVDLEPPARCAHWTIAPRSGCSFCAADSPGAGLSSRPRFVAGPAAPGGTLCLCGHPLGDHDPDDGLCMCGCPAWRPGRAA